MFIWYGNINPHEQFIEGNEKLLARILVANILAEMKKRGYESVHISVAAENIPAQKTYRHFDFVTVGQAEMWGHSFYLCELTL